MSEAQLVGVVAERCSLRGANLEQVNASDSSLDFSDLRDTRIVGTQLVRASLVGCELAGAAFENANLREADLFWTSASPERLAGCRTPDARLPEPLQRPAHGPRGVTPPSVTPRELYPESLRGAERAERAAQRPAGCAGGAR
jgi:uncharacterized protein YjbI with pentapeptide repeats